MSNEVKKKVPVIETEMYVVEDTPSRAKASRDTFLPDPSPEDAKKILDANEIAKLHHESLNKKGS